MSTAVGLSGAERAIVAVPSVTDRKSTHPLIEGLFPTRWIHRHADLASTLVARNDVPGNPHGIAPYLHPNIRAPILQECRRITPFGLTNQGIDGGANVVVRAAYVETVILAGWSATTE